MDFNRYKEINDTKMNYRQMEDATVISDYQNSSCGDGYRIYLKIDRERIVDASYTTNGCGFSVAALAMMTEIAKGKTIEEASKLNEQDIENMFAFPEKRKTYPQSAISALKQAILVYRSK